MKQFIKQWQKHIGVKDDGVFGPRTLEASIRFSKQFTGELPNKAALQVPEPVKTASVNLKKASRPINEIIIHCAATPEGMNVSVDTIRTWHKQRGWNDIGYHYVIDLDGNIHVGRDVDKVGAHVAGRNTGTIGICYVGGVDKNGKTAKDTRTAAQRKALKQLVTDLTKIYNIQKISGHNQYAAKACPSFDVRTDELGNIPGYTRGIKN